MQALRIPISGKCVGGSFTYVTQTRFAYWTMVNVAVLGTANSQDVQPQWLVSFSDSVDGAASGIALFGQGNGTTMGPIIVAPGEYLTVLGTGLFANSAVGGMMWGVQAETETEIASLLSSTSAVSNFSGGALPVRLVSVSASFPPLRVTTPQPMLEAFNQTIAVGNSGAAIGTAWPFALLRRVFLIVDTAAASGIAWAIQSADGTQNLSFGVSRFPMGQCGAPVEIEFDDIQITGGPGIKLVNGVGSSGTATFYGVALGR
jgi:hypothetical protein